MMGPSTQWPPVYHGHLCSKVMEDVIDRFDNNMIMQTKYAGNIEK